MSDDAPFIGETIQVSTVTGDLHRALDGLLKLGVGPFMVFRMGPDNCVDFTHQASPPSTRCWSRSPTPAG